MYFYLFITSILSILLISTLTISIYKLGVRNWLCHEYIINPIARKLINKYIQYIEYKITKLWNKRIDIISYERKHEIRWIQAYHINDFYFLDHHSEDIIPFLMNKPLYYKIPWIKARLGGKYLQPDIKLSPCYNYTLTKTGIKVQTDSQPDTWVYFTSKHKLPISYAIDFDFITHSETEETLQIDFCCKSLTERLRFIIVKNRELRFEVVNRGFFIKNRNTQKAFSFPLHKEVHIRVEIINNTFIFYANHKPQMAVHINKFIAKESFCYFIFWNYNKKEEINFEINNLKIEFPIKNQNN